MIDIFEFSNYREVLQVYIKVHAPERGYQTRLALGAGCKRSFLSQVLHSHINLTPDHGAGLCVFWQLNEDQTDWFMELLALERAGTPEMQKLCKRRLATLKERHLNLTERLKPKRLLNKEAQADYYSSWYWAAIHMLVGIPKFSSVPEIAKKLQLREDLVRETLLSLEKMRLVKKTDGQRWQVLETDLHVAGSSSLNLVNHVNWRQRAIANIQINDAEALHYTAVHTLSLKDLRKLHEKMIATIRETREIVGPSKDEELVCLSCDFFKV